MPLETQRFITGSYLRTALCSRPPALPPSIAIRHRIKKTLQANTSNGHSSSRHLGSVTSRLKSLDDERVHTVLAEVMTKCRHDVTHQAIARPHNSASTMSNTDPKSSLYYAVGATDAAPVMTNVKNGRENSSFDDVLQCTRSTQRSGAHNVVIFDDDRDRQTMTSSTEKSSQKYRK